MRRILSLALSVALLLTSLTLPTITVKADKNVSVESLEFDEISKNTASDESLSQDSAVESEPIPSDRVTLNFDLSKTAEGRNTFYVNGIELEFLRGGPFSDKAYTASFPKSWLRPEGNVITFVPWLPGTGNFNPLIAPEVRNYCDMTIKNLTMTVDTTVVSAPTKVVKHFPADTATAIFNKETRGYSDYQAGESYTLGDGDGGANADINVAAMIDFVFDAPAESDDMVTLTFGHNSNLQTSYKNAVFVNGEFYQYLENSGQYFTREYGAVTSPAYSTDIGAATVRIPKNLLAQGENKISFICGSNETGTYYNVNEAPNKRNHNDPLIHGVALSADGAVELPEYIIKHFPVDANTPVAQMERTESASYLHSASYSKNPTSTAEYSYRFGDGTPHPALNVPYMIDFVFDLDLGMEEPVPAIRHTPVDVTNVNATITAEITNATDATVYYKTDDTQAYKTASMAQDGTIFKVTLPKEELTSDTLKYYISAAGNGGIATYPESDPEGTPCVVNVTVQPPLGKATLTFNMASLQTGFNNALLVNGKFCQSLVTNENSIEIPGYLLTSGENKISFICGSNTTGTYYNVNEPPCSRNHNDPTVSNLSVNAGGAIVMPTTAIRHYPVSQTTPVAEDERVSSIDYVAGTTYTFGDGQPNSAQAPQYPQFVNLNIPYMVDFVFDFSDFTWDDTKEITIKNPSLQIGADKTKRNIVWYSTDDEENVVQVALKSDMAGDVFPNTYDEFVAEAKKTSVPSGYISYRTTIEGLAANTEYVYRVGNKNLWSAAYCFRTGSFGNDFNFLFGGDAQISDSTHVAGWTDTLTKGLALSPDAAFLLSLGDQVNASSNESQYDMFLSPEILKSIAIAPVHGNHDASPIYSSHFNPPNVSTLGTNGNGGEASGDYWYVYGNTLFMVLNNNNTDVQVHKQFMEETIAANRDVKWKVVAEHLTLFSITNSGYWGTTGPLRDALAPVFSELGIDIVLDGHDHSYMRTYMMEGTTPVIPTEDGVPTKVINPPFGQVLYVNTNSMSGSLYCGLSSTAPFVAVKNQENVPNISKATVTDNSFTLTTYRTNDMTVVDEFTIFKGEVPLSITAKAGEELVALNLSAVPAEATKAELQISTDNATWQTLSITPLADGNAKGAYLKQAFTVTSDHAEILGLTGGTQYYFKLIVTGGKDEGEYTANATPKKATVSAEIISTENTVWSYLDNNIDPGTEQDRYAWTNPLYDDRAWKSAKGSFGAKKGGVEGLNGGFTINTLLNQYIDGVSGADIPTYFFRTKFHIQDASKVMSLTGNFVIDDAAIIYINGVKAAEFNVPSDGYPNNMSYGSAVVYDAPGSATINITDTSMLVNGENTIAVELHNNRVDSSDIYLDFISLAANITDMPVAIGNIRYDNDIVTVPYTVAGNIPDGTILDFIAFAAQDGDSADIAYTTQNVAYKVSFPYKKSESSVSFVMPKITGDGVAGSDTTKKLIIRIGSATLNNSSKIYTLPTTPAEPGDFVVAATKGDAKAELYWTTPDSGVTSATLLISANGANWYELSTTPVVSSDDANGAYLKTEASIMGNDAAEVLGMKNDTTYMFKVVLVGGSSAGEYFTHVTPGSEIDPPPAAADVVIGEISMKDGVVSVPFTVKDDVANGTTLGIMAFAVNEGDTVDTAWTTQNIACYEFFSYDRASSVISFPMPLVTGDGKAGLDTTKVLLISIGGLNLDTAKKLYTLPSEEIDPPETPISFTASSGEKKAVLSWPKAAEGATAVGVQISLNGQNWSALSGSALVAGGALNGAYLNGAISTDATTVEVRGLTAGVTYFFKLTVVGGASAGVYTATATPSGSSGGSGGGSTGGKGDHNWSSLPSGGGFNGNISLPPEPTNPDDKPNDPDTNDEPSIQDLPSFMPDSAKQKIFAQTPWAIPSITALVQLGAIDGTTEDFRPNDTVTRAEFIKMIVCVLGLELDYTTDSSFSDAPQGQWYTPYIIAGTKAGIINGMGDGTFGVEAYISRQDIAAILYRAAQNTMEKGNLAAFSDAATVADYAADGVGALAKAGIVNGLGDGTFAPFNHATRAETAKMVAGTYQYMKEQTAKRVEE